MKGRVQAALVVCAITLLSWKVPFVSLLAAAGIALPTLRKGGFEGVVILAMATLMVAIAGGLMLGGMLQAGGYALILWVPVWLMAILLRESSRLELVLTGSGIVGIMMVVGIFAIYAEPAVMWLEGLQRLVRPVLERAPPDLDTDQVWRNVEEFSRYMTGVVAAGSVLSLILSLFIARWWQAMLFNPGGFHAEFVNLRLPGSWGYLALGLLALAWFAGEGISEIAWNITFPLLVLFLMAGFAVLHALFSTSSARRFWLVGVYLSLMFVPYVVVPIMLIGFSDVWVNWRHRLLSG